MVCRTPSLSTGTAVDYMCVSKYLQDGPRRRPFVFVCRPPTIMYVHTCERDNLEYMYVHMTPTCAAWREIPLEGVIPYPVLSYASYQNFQVANQTSGSWAAIRHSQSSVIDGPTGVSS